MKYKQKQRMKRFVFLSLFLALAVTSVRGQGRFVFTPQWTAQAQFAGYYVAQEKGFYREAGIEVEIVHPSLTQSAMDRIHKGESHATTLQLCQAMEIIDSGIPLVNILQTSMNNAMVIVSRCVRCASPTAGSWNSHVRIAASATGQVFSSGSAANIWCVP